jgi:hypothetical protein
MRRRLGLLAAVWLVALAGAASAAPPGWDASRYMSVDQLRPGMKGIGRSVFSGTDTREFDVEILGVMPTSTPRQRIILARLSGQGLEKSGVVAGMSGSPIYVDGKLIGALAYGWSYSTEPITGITPIADMLALEGRSAAPATAESEGSPPSRGALPPDTWNALWKARGKAAFDLLAPARPGPPGDLAPLRVPVAVGGFGTAAGSEAQDLLSRLGFMPVATGAAGEDASLPDTLGPGSAVGVELVRGDAQLAAIGTVTWSDGRRILAFGHPMMNRGASAYPMTAARIVTVLPRLSSSFKMGVVGPPIGAVTRDYEFGIMGEMGPAPSMIPVDVDLNLGDRSENLRFQILDAEGLTPALAGLVAASGMESANRSQGAVTVSTTVVITLGDGRRLTTRSVGAGFSPPTEIAGDVGRLVGLVYGNPFDPVTISRVQITTSVEDSIQAAFLEGIAIGPGPYHPGSRVPVEVRLRDYRGRTRIHRTGITIPVDLPPGTYRLTACDGQSDFRQETARAPDRYQPRSLDRLLAILGEETPYDVLVLRLLDTPGDPVVEGRELPRLPASLRTAVVSAPAGGRVSATAASVVATEREPMGEMILGCESVSVAVEPRR